jgi:hypothetical protein
VQFSKVKNSVAGRVNQDILSMNQQSDNRLSNIAVLAKLGLRNLTISIISSSRRVQKPCDECKNA